MPPVAPAKNSVDPIGIYVQIPFCASKCSFCNFSSRVERSENYGDYARAVCRETQLLPEIYARHGLDPGLAFSRVDTLYFGGGTPSLVGIESLEALVSSMRRQFRTTELVEFTLETTPGSADEEFLRRVRALGVNRLSIGAQSFDDHELKSVGRLHSSEETRRLVTGARRKGITNISLDLIAGLPHQTSMSWQTTLREALELSPEHVSIYLFEIDEKSRLGKEVLEQGSRYHANYVPDEDFMVEAYETARQFLAQAGLTQYEISNFAVPGFESRHNLKYWQLMPYVGLGAGAHSFDGSHRWANTATADLYSSTVLRGESPISDFTVLTSAQQLEEYFFLGLRQKEGVDLEAARRRWGPETFGRWELTISNLECDGWLEQRAGRLLMSDRAYLISNEIFQEFLVG